MENLVTIEKEKLEQLIFNFSSVCSFCNELNIYELPELYDSMQEMKFWVKTNFEIKK
jgi:hypothetical protein